MYGGEVYCQASNRICQSKGEELTGEQWTLPCYEICKRTVVWMMEWGNGVDRRGIWRVVWGAIERTVAAGLTCTLFAPRRNRISTQISLKWKAQLS
jgi:hypothetical protein